MDPKVRVYEMAEMSRADKLQRNWMGQASVLLALEYRAPQIIDNVILQYALPITAKNAHSKADKTMQRHYQLTLLMVNTIMFSNLLMLSRVCYLLLQLWKENLY